MATFRKRSGSWQAIVKKKGFGQIARTFNTKGEAEAWAKVAESELVRGVFVSRAEAENTSLSDALDRYEREVTPLKKGITQELSRIRILKSSHLASRSLASLQGKDIAVYRDYRLKEVSPATLRRELTILSSVFKYAIKEWGMGGLVNPVEAIRLPSARGKIRDRRLLPGELDRILATSESPVLPDIARFAVETAMREAEISRMEWEHVDLKKKVYFMPFDSQRKPTRNVPLSSEALAILERIPRRLDGKVWGVTGHAISVAWRRAVARARRIYEKECEERKEKPDPAFLVDLTFHDLRHEATSRFFEKGLNPMQVAAITGHKTLQMLKRYTHLKAEDLAEMLK